VKTSEPAPPGRTTGEFNFETDVLRHSGFLSIMIAGLAGYVLWGIAGTALRALTDRAGRWAAAVAGGVVVMTCSCSPSFVGAVMNPSGSTPVALAVLTVSVACAALFYGLAVRRAPSMTR
jgi:hypothetical protein